MNFDNPEIGERQLDASAVEVARHRETIIEDAVGKVEAATANIVSLDARRGQKEVAQIATNQMFKASYDAEKAA